MQSPEPTMRRRSSLTADELSSMQDLAKPAGSSGRAVPFKKILCANRGEIAIRVFRAAHELGLKTVAIYSEEDRKALHRYKADAAFLVGKGKNPVRAYLDMEGIISIAKSAGVDAIHPGYGFLSENEEFARLCAMNGIVFIGPDAEVIHKFGDKTEARKEAAAVGVPCVPGSEDPLSSAEDCVEFAKQFGLPIILKAAFGGGGRGMRIVRTMEEIPEAFSRAYSEALQAFGNGAIFVERFIENPKHIEVQILGDGVNVIHLYERDCSVQRRHQKVVEIAPAPNLPKNVRENILKDAVKLMKSVNYSCAGTVEFLYDVKNDKHYFIEVNPRVQVEHTVTEEVTGVDIVQSQILIAGGFRLADLDLSQEIITCQGFAIQCRVTTEDPERNFQPDTGRIEAYRAPGGMGVRLDGGTIFGGAEVLPHYDSMLVKVTCRGLTFRSSLSKMLRTLNEIRVRGVKTNIAFLRRLLKHNTFVSGAAHTNFIDQTPSLFVFSTPQDRAQKLLRYLGEVIVNGTKVVGAQPGVPCGADAVCPTVDVTAPPPRGWKNVLDEEGPAGFARAIRQHSGLLLTDTTWRDAHQSLLATRMRTYDLMAVAPATARLFHNLLSLEMWGGATFDVCLRFLRECPWERLMRLRAQVPNVPFQMLLRGANGVGYTSYPDNVIYDFTKKAKECGVDIFRVFDSLNYMPNLKLGIDAVIAAGGVAEGTISYTGDVSDTSKTKYSLEYYVNLARELVDSGCHILGIKDMAGLLKPRAARMLISALRKEFPDMPIHVHCHDTSGCGVAAMLACAENGADVVDVAIDAMSGMTSQPSLGAVVAACSGSPLDTGFKLEDISMLNDYWEQVRELYAPFDSGQKSGSSDVYIHEMPGGQLTNLQFQSRSLGLQERWPQIKRAYAAANRVLGDIIKVTPSSKVVGDLAQFMVQNDLTEESVVEKAHSLSFPNSVVEFMQGYMGQPVGGFPEPFRTHVLKGREAIDGRPGESLPPMDLVRLKNELCDRWGADNITDNDVSSAALYPKVFEEYMEFRQKYGDVDVLPTRLFVHSLTLGEEREVSIEPGKTLIIKLLATADASREGSRDVYFELNGRARALLIDDAEAQKQIAVHEKADPTDEGSVGAPMSGAVVDCRVSDGQLVKKGDPICVMTAMKMEIVVAAAVGGKVTRVLVKPGSEVAAGDLLAEIEHVRHSISIEDLDVNRAEKS